jgi:hypothetical protein
MSAIRAAATIPAATIPTATPRRAECRRAGTARIGLAELEDEIAQPEVVAGRLRPRDHISSKDIPNWIWATFEHVGNPGRCDYTGCNDSYGELLSLAALFIIILM